MQALAPRLAACGLDVARFDFPYRSRGSRRPDPMPALRVPVLCINGTRDRLCRRDLMERVVEKVSAPWRMRWLEGAGHSFGLTAAAESEISAWIGSLR